MAEEIDYAAFKEHQVVPDVIPFEFRVSTELQISYPNSRQQVQLGNSLTPAEASEQPTVDFVPPQPSEKYTLVMTDPDAPSRTDPKFGPWRHWIVTNIDGQDVQKGLMDLNNHHTPYVGPGPPPNSGTHRYVFLLYRQRHEKNFAVMGTEREERRKFDLRAFETENELQLVSANFFICPT
ncbi:OV-16 antigen [Choanephora cucurbitarum]|uniref:OV-16 antigen n=1 Tax=Choanephora cucurbitarum TaxID=101091 RepID=A0A1C7NK75_9FUNG|nr:OV-16 antigen [Choanephora cucurbitarum]